MRVQIKGQFLENGSYHSNKTNQDVYYATVLVGAQAVQISGIHLNNKKRLDDITLDVDVRAYNNTLLCSAIKN